MANEILTQVKRYLNRTFEVLAALTSATSDYMEQMTQLHNKNGEKSSKSLKNIPTKYQNMILVTSSVGEITEVDYKFKAVELFKCSNNITAQVMLNSQFEIERIECSVSSAVPATLIYGRFLCKNPLSPSGLGASVISSKGLFCMDTLHEVMVLDYSAKFDISIASLSKLTKTQVVLPVYAEELIHHLQ